MVETSGVARRRLPALGIPFRRSIVPVLAAAAVAWLVAELTATGSASIGVRTSGWMTLGAMALAASYFLRRRFRLLSLFMLRPFTASRPLRRFSAFIVRLDEMRTWRVAHLWIGTLFLLPLYWHVRSAEGGIVEQVLFAAILVVVASGLAGVLLQYLLPQAMLRSPEREVRLRDVRAQQRALFVEAEERILGRSDALVDAYLRVLRPILDADSSRRRLLMATVQRADPAELVRQRAVALDVTLAEEEAALFSELAGLTERKVRLDFNCFQLQMTTGWLVLHGTAVGCAGVLLVLHILSVIYFGGL